MWTYFCLGLLVGWAVEWLIDLLYWRRRASQGGPAASLDPTDAGHGRS